MNWKCMFFRFDLTMDVMNLNIGRYCCDPYKRHKKKILKDLHLITREIIHRNPSMNLTLKQKICKRCKSELNKSVSPEPSICEESDNESVEDIVADEYEKAELNSILSKIKETPIKATRVSHSPHYATTKFKKIEGAVKRKLELVTNQSILSSDSDDKAQIEIVEQLKEKFNSVTKHSEKITILTLLPKSWTRTKIMTEFHCSNYMVRKAKALVKEFGVLATPNPRLGKRLGSDVTAKVHELYHSQEVSREMPGLKDYVSIKRADGIREQKQKCLMLCNLREAYEHFKEKHPEVKIGFSKFAALRPKECVLPGASGTHSVCVCAKHQNVKLMVAAIENVFKNNSTDTSTDDPDLSTSSLPQLDDGPDTNYICHYRHCLALLQCNPPQEICFFGECDNCPRKEEFINFLTAKFDRQGIDEIEFRHWISTDRSTLESQRLSADEFVQIFHEKLQALLQHDFFAKAQMSFLQQKKAQLNEGEFLVVGDFAENYSFIVQDAVQSFHWNNCQATLHPFVAYYRKDNELAHKSFVAISDCNQHDVIAVHLFQTRLINFLKASHQLNKIFYFSDGCAAQYKNRNNFINLCHHFYDFNVEAEWHFFATSHGKGPCDGIGGTVKRLAARASLQRTGGMAPILNPYALYDFAVKALPAIAFTFTTAEEHEAHRRMLQSRFENAKTIPGKCTK